MLTFNAETHEYRWNGKPVPSVTQILGACGIINTAWFTEDATWRGSAIHKACELDDQDDLDAGKKVSDPWEHTVHDEHVPYLKAYRAFKKDMHFRPRLIEQPMYWPDPGIAGTPDVVGWMSCSRGPDYEAVIDRKSGAESWWHKIQLAAYSEMAHVLPRFILRLKPNGKYVLREMPIAERSKDLRSFRTAFEIHLLKEDNK